MKLPNPLVKPVFLYFLVLLELSLIVFTFKLRADFRAPKDTSFSFGVVRQGGEEFLLVEAKTAEKNCFWGYDHSSEDLLIKCFKNNRPWGKKLDMEGNLPILFPSSFFEEDRKTHLFYLDHNGTSKTLGCVIKTKDSLSFCAQ